MNLHARVFRTADHWYADLDDGLFPQPDNPLWCGSYPSQSSALAAVCTLIAELADQKNAIHHPIARHASVITAPIR
ncbi:hypothetical protein E1263_29535 [Kribbella antibiotica]|uniref:Uncharacterized protein n=1 Tax=Kribbella antibiotica TaxID=190195 RepID=A0A4V6PE01_9ACTN|nr:hypothetical protein E1263_29535 [Kribbella antibiotica]